MEIDETDFCLSDEGGRNLVKLLNNNCFQIQEIVVIKNIYVTHIYKTLVYSNIQIFLYNPRPFESYKWGENDFEVFIDGKKIVLGNLTPAIFNAARGAYEILRKSIVEDQLKKGVAQ
jgi:hypothetical protein